MGRRREISMPGPVDASRLVSADHLRWYVSTHPRWGGLTDERLGEELGLTAGYVGMVMSGARTPTKAFLKAIGWEAVTLYRMKAPAMTILTEVDIAALCGGGARR